MANNTTMVARTRTKVIAPPWARVDELYDDIPDMAAAHWEMQRCKFITRAESARVSTFKGDDGLWTAYGVATDASENPIVFIATLEHLTRECAAAELLARAKKVLS
jgi:hypothetical protein